MRHVRLLLLLATMFGTLAYLGTAHAQQQTGQCMYDTATVWVYTCTAGGTRADKSENNIGQWPSGNTAEIPGCTGNSGTEKGQWQQLTAVNSLTCEDLPEGAGEFDPSTLNANTLATAFGAGFVVMATGLLIGWAVRVVISAVKQGL